MKQIEINIDELVKWKNETWQLYASQSVKLGRLSMWVSYTGLYRVCLGKEKLYEGSQISHAIEAWKRGSVKSERIQNMLKALKKELR